jgi:acetylornithine deacetylase/succinyl-diaminopimelate desuccinylase-like protein
VPTTPAHAELLSELAELIAIPSISADPAHAADLSRAAAWVSERIRRAGGTVEIEQRNGRPLVLGAVPASAAGEAAPTVLVYAHLDVQPADPVELWHTDPWELTEREGLLVARGIADDKAHLFMLLKATELLSGAGELRVNVRFAIDAEEEIGGHSVVDWVEEDTLGADVALVLDGGYATPDLPSFCNALRGICYFHLIVRTGERDLHSGMFGGAALNAVHALLTTVQALLAGPDGRVPEPMRVGIIPPTEAEVAGWAALRTGDEELAGSGAKPMDATAARDFWLRTTSEPTVEVNGITGGSPTLQKTVLPVEAHANLSVRLAPGQSSAVVVPIVERLLRDALPPGAELDLALWSAGEPAWIDPEGAAVRLAQDAFESVLGVRPVLARSGGSIPVAAALGAKGIPAIVAGFSRPTAQMHSPDENLPSSALVEGVETIVATLSRFGELPRSTSLG